MDGLGLSQGLGLGQKPQQPQMNDEQMNAWIDQTIGKNTHLNFIDRVARPELYPTLPTEDGGMMTHKMAWSTTGKDNMPVVYPTVIFDPNSMALKQLDDDAAFEHAMKTKEFLPFPTEQSADLFSREYKRHWRDGKGPQGYQP